MVSLLVKEGDTVTQGQTILELENEKAVAPIPSTATGVVAQIRVREGDRITVGQVILTVTESGAAPAPSSTARSIPKAAPIVVPVREASAAAPDEMKAEAEIEAPVEGGMSPAASPEIRRLARELGIDLRRVRGSERGGRIVMVDVRAYLLRLQTQAATPKPVPSVKPAATPAE